MKLTKQIIDNDFVHLKKLALFGPEKRGRFFDYSNIYPFTNDKLKDIYKELDCSKGALSVTASGDQALMAILNDAPKVTMFDINHLAKYFALFKFTAIESLSYDEFIKLYKVNVPFNNFVAGGFLNKVNTNLYEKVCSNMDSLPSRFFELLYDFFQTATSSEKSNIINIKHYPKLSGYLNRKDYDLLKEKIKDVKEIEYIDCDIFDLKKHIGDEKYSAIIFSNISSYFHCNELNNFLILLKELDDNLTDNALVQAGYGNVRYSVEVGKNRMNPNFVDSNSSYFKDVISGGQVITFYKPTK